MYFRHFPLVSHTTMAYCTKLATFLQSCFSFLLLKICILILAVILLAVFSLFLPLALILFLYRYILNKWAGRYLRPSLGEMVTARGALFSGDAVFSRKRPKVNMVVQGALSERVEVERVLNIFKTRILPAKRDDGKLAYPELMQYPKSWGGFYFWEWDPNFNLSDHVKYHRIQLGPDSILSSEDEAFNKFHEELLHKEWSQNKPIWEVWVVQVDKNQADKTAAYALFMKTHHSLVDGYSLLYLISKFSDIPVSAIGSPKPVPVKRPLWKSMAFLTTFPFRAVYELSSITIQRYSPFTPLPFMVPFSLRKANMHYTCTQPIPIEKVKQIKNYFKVPFTSVMNAMVSGALRELMLLKGVQIPPKFPTLVPLPLKGHPEQSLRNYLGGAVALLSTGESDPVKRLRACHADYEGMKTSTFPLLTMLGLKFIGSLPVWMIRNISSNWLTSSYFTNFPSFQGERVMDVDGIPILSSKVAIGLYIGPTGLGFCAVSYRNDITVSITGHGAIFSKSDMDELSEYLEGQIDLLHTLIAHPLV